MYPQGRRRRQQKDGPQLNTISISLQSDMMNRPRGIASRSVSHIKSSQAKPILSNEAHAHTHRQKEGRIPNPHIKINLSL